jgi:hypothetical protein
MKHFVVRWGGLWRDRAKDECSEHLLFEDCIPVLFRTRQEARAYIERKYGYIKTRKDLRTHPHYWRLPVPVRVMTHVIK